MNVIHMKIDEKIGLIIGSCLAGLSALLTLNLFLALAHGNPLYQVIMGLLAVFLEAAKILLFRRRGLVKVIGVILVGISLLASFGSALLVVSEDQAVTNQKAVIAAHQSFAYLNSKAEVESLDSQITMLIEKRKALPSDFITAGNQLTDQIAALRSRKDAVLKEMARQEAYSTGENASSPTTMFGLFAKVFGLDENLIVLLILLALAGVLEASSLALTAPRYSTPPLGSDGAFQPKESPEPTADIAFADLPQRKGKAMAVEAHEEPQDKEKTSTPNPGLPDLPMAFHEPSTRVYTADEFLQEMGKGLPYPNLRGRNATAERIGIPYYRAQVLVKELLRDGKIRVVGKRLVRAGTFHGPSSMEAIAESGSES